MQAFASPSASLQRATTVPNNGERMYILPLPFLLGTIAGLLSLALLAGGVYIIWAWYVGTLVATFWLVTGLAAVFWSLFGRKIVLAFYPHGAEMPPAAHGNEGEMLRGPDGSDLYIEFDGPVDGQVLVMTHGWALDSEAWYSVRRELAKTYRLVLWDLPGLGKSSQPADHRYSVARLAEDLRTVIAETGDKPVTLVGHSIGGMMMLTLARLHPGLFEKKIRGMVLLDTTHRWPLKTLTGGGLMRLLRWPVIEPLLLLTIVLSPLIRLINFMSYLNGTSHIVNRISSLSHSVTREQLDFASRYNVKDSPSVIAKGLLAVLRWEESATPPTIRVPIRAIAGNVDKLTRPEAGIEISQIAPDADFVQIDPAGHNGIIEQGQKYAEAIAQFQRRTALPAPG
jgi:pimeloyl-ACP methyl ester carboxylesterase